jgi:pseudaminic acid biosynthesis-associated methylase
LESDLNKNQQEFWKGDFGADYRNRIQTLESYNQFYEENVGFSEEELWKKHFSKFDRNMKILELGSNVGVKLSILKKMGFNNLTGVEINKKTYEIAKQNDPSINWINSSIDSFEPNEKFDLVFTSLVLIHINPKAVNSIIKKMIKISKKYLFGFEYFANELTEIPYRGHRNVMWKQNFPHLFKELEPSLKEIIVEKIPYKNNDLQDVMYLFEKTK